MRCNAAPYEGTKPFIFISYCHQDKASVYPYVEMLARDGYRVWYDEGITPGDEWTENIARHLEMSSVFLAFITEASLNSHNCRREINFAIQRNKNVISLFLDDVRLSAGMEMLLSSVQGIYRSQYGNPEDFVQKLCSSAVMDQCGGEKRQQEPVSEEELLDLEETVTLTQEVSGFAAGELETFLLRIRNLERIYIPRATLTIGRSRLKAEYVITGENSISRLHATIRKSRDAYMIMDNRSLNHVGINGRLITPEVEYEIMEYDVVSLAKEHMVFFKNYNEAGRRLMPGYELRDEKDTFSVPGLPLVRIGSQPLQQDGTGNELCIPEDSVQPLHAALIASSDGLYAVDLSGNHDTAINGRPLLFCEKVLLQPADMLNIGERSFEVCRKL